MTAGHGDRRTYSDCWHEFRGRRGEDNLFRRVIRRGLLRHRAHDDRDWTEFARSGTIGHLEDVSPGGA